MSTPPNLPPAGTPPPTPIPPPNPANPAAAPPMGNLQGRQARLVTVSNLDSFRIERQGAPTVPTPKAPEGPLAPGAPVAAQVPAAATQAPGDAPAIAEAQSSAPPEAAAEKVGSGKEEKVEAGKGKKEKIRSGKEETEAVIGKGERRSEKKGSRIGLGIFGRGDKDKLKPQAEVQGAVPTLAPQPIAPQPTARRTADDLQSKIQDLLDLTQNQGHIEEYKDAEAKFTAAKKERKPEGVIQAAKERFEAAKRNYLEASQAQKELFVQTKTTNFVEAETALLNEIKQILVDVLKNPGGMAEAMSIIASVRIPTEGFLKMMLSLEPKYLQELIVLLAREEAGEKLPFRTDSLFTKLLRERSRQELGARLAPYIQQATQAVAQGQSPENVTVALLTSLRDSLRNQPPSQELQAIYRQIYGGRLLAENAAKSEVIFVSLFVLRVVNPLLMEGNETNIPVVKLTKQLQVAASIEENLKDATTGPLLREILLLLTGTKSV